VVGIHGYSESDGGVSTVGKLAPYFAAAGIKYSLFQYKSMNSVLTGVTGARFLNSTRALHLIGYMHRVKASGVVGFSNGCDVAVRAGHSALFHKAVLVHPAMDRDAPMPKRWQKVLVLYDDSDLWVRLAAKIPWHSWGSAGAYGFDDPIAENWQYDPDKQVVAGSEHSKVWRSPILERVAERIVNVFR
jgi:hypothetical protein